jgi:uncharacterized membrane protein YtjA (UPF0391 family)
LIAAIVGFGGIVAAGAETIGKVVFLVFLIGFVASLMGGFIRRESEQDDDQRDTNFPQGDMS